VSISTIRRLILIGLLLCIGFALSVASPTFFTLDNLMTLLQEASQTGIVAIGFTLILITAGIDMSIGAVIAITSMLCVNFLYYTHLPAYLFIPVALAAGCLIGWFNGYFITRFKHRHISDARAAFRSGADHCREGFRRLRQERVHSG
jgi:ribose/xylose/arabinose/galactoside ABC-type transport system permease subunit